MGAWLLDFVQYIFRPRRIPWVCSFSARHPGYDIHDYHVSAGGDGIPDHFREYTCWNCQKRFGI